MRSFFMLVMVLAAVQIFAAGQDQPGQNTDESRPTPAPALSGVIGLDAPVAEEDTSGDLPQIPELLGGQGASLAFRAEQERSNYLRGGLNVGATYDDNASLTSQGAVSNTTYSIFPNITVEQTFPRMRWNLGYAAGLTVNQRFSNDNQGSHDLNFDSQFRLSPHLNFRVAENFALTTGFFDSGSSVVAGGGGPNANLIAPLSKQRSSSTVMAANYHFALKDVIGASGSFYDLHFSDLEPGAILADTRAASGSAFWFHRLFGRDWIGASYRFQRLTFDPGSGLTNVHSFLVVNTIRFANRFTLTGFVGPEYSDNRGLVGGGIDQILHFTNWSIAGGGDAGWQKEHTSVSAGFSRRTNDGGGVLGVVQLQSVHADLRQELFPGWAIALAAGYGHSKALTVPEAGSASSADSATVGASLQRNLGRNLGLHLGYAHEFQDQSGTTNAAFQGSAHRNRFSVTLGYQWARPLGR